MRCEGGVAPGFSRSPMNAQEAQTLQLREIVVWTPDGTTGEVIVVDGSGVKVRWEDDQCGYYQFTDLLSQIERSP